MAIRPEQTSPVPQSTGGGSEANSLSMRVSARCRCRNMLGSIRCGLGESTVTEAFRVHLITDEQFDAMSRTAVLIADFPRVLGLEGNLCAHMCCVKGKVPPSRITRGDCLL